MIALTKSTPVLVVGAGIMGAGIAQVAAQAGHVVRLFDVREGAAAEARARLGATLDALAAKGKLSAADAAATLARIEPIARIEQAAGAGLVVEAIVEKLEAKRDLFRQLEANVAPECVFATNTSSISVTAIANGLARPERLVGMHFFNPVPLMKLVEVVSGLHTRPAVAQSVFDLAKAWGKVPVHARSTPGFIVNRIARPYYAEALALLQEQAASPAVLDACLRAAGFRMGPCELMDLIGHDTNLAVTSSVYEANFFDKRYVPSSVQRELVEGGLLGRKSGRGFYTYPEGPPALAPAVFEEPAAGGGVTLHGDGGVADRLASTLAPWLASQGSALDRARDSAWTGLAIGAGRLVLTDGRTADELATVLGMRDVAVFDLPLASISAPQALAYAPASAASDGWSDAAPRLLAMLGFAPQKIADAPGLVVARTIAMLINETADAVLQGVCTPDADAAMKLGVNYPAGPFEWLRAWSAAGVIGVVEALDRTYRGERYRVSPWLRRASHRTESE